mmetsp:Transcript_12266/g.36640  ORF Transcript_12266/g.36640 Transcript_12266/m.36640 type:complete len:203 (-) Transcript_12266:2577-3185(-)
MRAASGLRPHAGGQARRISDVHQSRASMSLAALAAGQSLGAAAVAASPGDADAAAGALPPVVSPAVAAGLAEPSTAGAESNCVPSLAGAVLAAGAPTASASSPPPAGADVCSTCTGGAHSGASAGIVGNSDELVGASTWLWRDASAAPSTHAAPADSSSAAPGAPYLRPISRRLWRKVSTRCGGRPGGVCCRSERGRQGARE